MKQFLVFLGQLLALTALWGNSCSGALGQTDTCNKGCFTAAPVSEEVQQVKFLSFSWIPGKRTGNSGFTIMRMGEGPREVDKKASRVDLGLSPNLFVISYTTCSACFFLVPGLWWCYSETDKVWAKPGPHALWTQTSETGGWNYFIEIFLFLNCRFAKWAFLYRISVCFIKVNGAAWQMSTSSTFYCSPVILNYKVIPVTKCSGKWAAVHSLCHIDQP